MKPVIFCKTTDKGVHTFYIKMDNGTKYLFSQNYRRGVNKYFSHGVSVAQVFNVKTYDKAVLNTKQKLHNHLKYIQKEYDVSVLNKKTGKPKSKTKRSMLYSFCGEGNADIMWSA